MDLNDKKSTHVVIIGGGASGTLVAIHLLNSGFQGRVTLVERDGECGRGVAYGKCTDEHLLNVRAINMSAFPSDPGHFARWLAANDLGEDSDAYVRLDYFGRYLGEVLKDASLKSPGRLSVVNESVRKVLQEGGRSKVACQSQTIEADHVVLALGNLPSRAPEPLCELRGHPRFMEDPWAGALPNIGASDSVLVIGTGLTMVDVALQLDSLGHRGNILARSRRGLMPQRHRLNAPVSFSEAELAGEDVVRLVTRRVKEAGDDWRGVIDGLRAHTPAIWGRFSWEYRAKLIRRIQPYWDVYRHRMPGPVADRIEGLISSGRWSVGKGSIEDTEVVDGRFEVSYRGAAAPVTVDWIVNCTGPQTNWRRAKSPVLESLVKDGSVQYDPLGLGLMVDGDGRVGSNVWALGPLCRGCRFETTAIPEIRAQAARIAACLVGG